MISDLASLKQEDRCERLSAVFPLFCGFSLCGIASFLILNFTEGMPTHVGIGMVALVMLYLFYRGHRLEGRLKTRGAEIERLEAEYFGSRARGKQWRTKFLYADDSRLKRKLRRTQSIGYGAGFGIMCTIVGTYSYIVHTLQGAGLYAYSVSFLGILYLVVFLGVRFETRLDIIRRQIDIEEGMRFLKQTEESDQ